MDLKTVQSNSFKIESLIDKYENLNIDFRKRIEKFNTGDRWLKICCWNIQRLNKRQINERAIKIEFIRDCFNENKFDIIFLVDVDDDKDILHLNTFNKISDGRNLLFIKDNINLNFDISKNIIYNTEHKIAFVYLTPNSKDEILNNNLKVLLENGFTLVGDINMKSNKWICNYVSKFTGEDSLQTGFINSKVTKYYSIAGPSDHRLIAGYVFFKKIKFNYSLRVKEISKEHSKNVITDIVNGRIPKFEPKVTIKQGYLNLSDREDTINAMINDYLDNNVRKTFKKYNYLWKFDKREPFLGTKAPQSVIDSFALHLKNNNNKQYKNFEIVALGEEICNKFNIKKTKSKALNHDFISLKNITDILKEIYYEDNLDVEEIINNILSVAGKCKTAINAETFFLQKNKKLKDFNDVRVIVIIPTLVKLYESLIYDVVVDYFTKKFNLNVRYQFGGVKNGSTYAAMCNIRINLDKHNSNSIVLLDLSKGYDTILFDHLFKFITNIDDVDIKTLIYNWAILVYNMDIVMNNSKIRKTRGLAMGLSLSPIIFVWYIDNILRDFDKSRLTMYIDDLAIIISFLESMEENYKFVMDVIGSLEKFGLVVNLKKTVLISSNELVIETFKDKFKIINEDKYLGRQICLSGDGRIINDDRFFNKKGFRVFAIPSFATFFIKRLIYNGALEAKLRYKLMMWSCNDPVTRKAIWQNNWFFFKNCMGEYSYLQLAFASFNLFRYFVDVVDIIKWRDRLDNGENVDIINNEVVLKIRTFGIDQLENCYNLEIKWDFIEDDIFIYTKKFLNNLWNSFKENLIIKYINTKMEKKIKFYYNIRKFLYSKVFNHFGFIQGIALKHADFKRRKKQLFFLVAFKALGEFLELIEFEFYSNEHTPAFNYHDIIKFLDMDRYKKINLNDFDNNTWKIFFDEECINLWKYIDIWLKIGNDAKRKCKYDDGEWKNKINEKYPKFYVDGSYNIETETVGYGGYVEYLDGKCESYNGIINSDSCKKYRNVAGELLGAIKLIEIATEKKCEGINLIYDFKGIECYANGTWYTNNDFIKENYIYKYNELRKKIKINFVKVSSHTNIFGNEAADILAKKAVGMNIIKEEEKDNNNKWDKVKCDYIKKVFKTSFKFCTTIELITCNNNLNDLNLEELLLNLKVKLFNLEDLLNKIFNLVDLDDFDYLDTNFYDLYEHFE